MKNWRPVLLITLAWLAAYGWSIQNEFCWDDEVLVIGNALIRSFSNIPIIFTQGFWAGDGSYYRPLSILSYLIDYQLWGLDPLWFHLNNILIHLFGSITLFFVLRWHFSERASFWSALLYCVHPAISADIFAVFGRNGLLENLVCLIGLLGVQRLALSPYWGLGTLFCFVLGLLSKESALSYALIVTLYAWTLTRLTKTVNTKLDGTKLGGTKLRRIRIIQLCQLCAALWGIAGIYAVVRILYFPFHTNVTLSLIAKQPYPIRAWTAIEGILHYFGLIFFPIQLRTERHFVSHILDPGPWLGLLACAILGYAAIALRRKKPFTTFGILWFFVTLIPVSNLVVIMPYTIRESLLYVPLVGCAWVLAEFLNDFLDDSQKQIKFWQAGLTALSLLFVARTFARGLDWKDGFTIYSTDIKNSPNSFLLATNLGVEYFRKGDPTEAKHYFEKALEIEPKYAMARNNLGAIQRSEGNLASAEESYRKAVQYGEDALSYFNLGELLLSENRKQEAEEVLLTGQRKHPFDEKIRDAVSKLKSQR